jgi:hypothetical protein
MRHKGLFIDNGGDYFVHFQCHEVAQFPHCFTPFVVTGLMLEGSRNKIKNL